MSETTKGKVLIVDDEDALLRGYSRLLKSIGYSVDTARDGQAATELVKQNQYEVVVSDISMPNMDGLNFLRAVRERDLDLPVILVTGSPAVESAVKAMEFGAFRYLLKPVDTKQFEEVVDKAYRVHKMARLKREALAQMGAPGAQAGDLAGLEAAFGRALLTLRMVYQPIVCWSKKAIHAYEGLVRSSEPVLPHPGALLSAAERLNRLEDVGRAIRSTVAGVVKTAGQPTLFVNLHTKDLLDENLYSPDAPLSRIAEQVVLEITERAALDVVKDVRDRIARLRKMGYRVAVDDLGAGYAGLTSFAQLEPEVVKLDMSLVRDVHKQPLKTKLIRSMISLCAEMGQLVVAEGVETIEERDTLVSLGCDYFQGYLFAKPGQPFPEVTW